MLILSFSIAVSSAQTVETPIIDYITVNQATGKPEIVWTINNPSLVNGYSVKRYIYSCSSLNFAPNSFHTIKLIDNPFQLFYEDNSTKCPADPDSRKETYGIIAYKITGSDTTRSSIDALHQTIFLQTEFDYCKKQNILTWNNYISWGNNFKNYEIYCKINTGSYTHIGTTGYNDTVFTHSNINDNTNYEYYIKAVRNDGAESMSNIKALYTNTINFPVFLNTDSLVANKKVNLYFNVDTGSDTKRYILYKSENYNGVFDSVAGAPHSSKNILHFTDEYNQTKNYYYLSAIDYCGNEIKKTQTISNIKLEVEKLPESKNQNKLIWDYDFNNEFVIFKSKRENTSFSEINRTFNLNYIDNIQPDFEEQFVNQTSDGTFCYYITSEKNNFYNKSNTECVTYEETIFIANAFNPNSNIEENRFFKPKIAFVSNYELTIYGKFGNIIFQSNNPDYGWNGKLPNGELAERAAYLYFLSYTNAVGKRIQKKGFVSLVY